MVERARALRGAAQRAFGEVSKQMMAKLANVPLRYDSKLVPLLPPDTFIYAAVPNVTREIADAGLDLERRIQANPQLKAWFDQQRQANPDAPDMAEVLARFRELGSYLGNELVRGGVRQPYRGPPDLPAARRDLRRDRPRGRHPRQRAAPGLAVRRADPGHRRGRPGHASSATGQGALRVGSRRPCRGNRLGGRDRAPGGRRPVVDPDDTVLRADRALLPGRRDLAVRGRRRAAHRHGDGRGREPTAPDRRGARAVATCSS